MAKPSKGDLVLVEYSIWAENGERVLVGTTSEEVAKKEGMFNPKKRYGEIPLLLGSGAVLEPVEEALLQMEEGEEREIEVPPEKAYGEYRKDLVVRVSKKRLREAGYRPVVGEEVNISGRTGRIVKVTERFVYIDFNHPLAGKRLIVRIKLNKIAREDPEKIKLLAVRYLRFPPESIEVKAVGNDEYELVLPSETLLVKDLEAILLGLLEDIYKTTNTKKIKLIINVEFKREESSPATEEESKSDEQTTGEAEEV